MKKLIAIAVILLSLAVVPAGAHHGTTQTATYYGIFDAPSFLGNDPACAAKFGLVCFDVNEDGLSNLHFEVTDASGLDVTAYASVYTPSGIFGEQQFCGSHDIPVFPGTHIDQVVVHIGGVQQDGCGPLSVLPKVGPIPLGAFSFGTTGEVRLTYS
ncbi:MAG: hypothetical protein ABR548_07300 [Actinomycetota bacterium]|nr:hypothetical protein [Actinomycetota bacterium]